MATNTQKDSNNKIFKLNRISFSELWNDAVDWITATYKATKAQFTTASPFGQLLQVILHLGNMIFYYIEDSITGLNIRTAYRPDQIKGLATLTGHDSARPISSRGEIHIVYYNNENNVNSEYKGQVAYIPNKLSVYNVLNGLNYVVILSGESAKITMEENKANYITANIIQGTLKYQRATATGMPLQSFNFNERNHAEFDQFFVNIYVNGELWPSYSSLIDLGYNQKGCVVKTGMNGGIDVFFGNQDMGAIPARGAVILAEYIVSDGEIANLPKEYVNADVYWQFKDKGYLSDGTELDLNNYFKIICTTDIIFGSNSEDLSLTQRIAPYSSRAMVLANTVNYKYFLARMNMFSVIEIVTGTNIENKEYVQANLDKVINEYDSLNENYNKLVSLYGEKSSQAQDVESKMNVKLDQMTYLQNAIDDSNIKDNTVYIYLVPDVSKRISSANNYFTCDESVFSLTEEEKINIENLIEASGQRILTVENRVMSPRMPRFAINVEAKIWEGYSETDVYNDCLNEISKYLISNQRSKQFPVSDLVALLEDVKGINSVKVSFAADRDNDILYSKPGFYGIDEFGDIVMTRNVVDTYGSKHALNDLYPLFRGGFIDPNGVQYEKTQSQQTISAFNFKVTEVTPSTSLNIQNLQAVN